MPLLSKVILPAGTFLVRSNKGRIKRTYNEQELQELAEGGNAMIAAGLKIPAPFDHSKDAVPEVNGKSAPAYNNAGYWEQFYVSKDSKGRPALAGFVDLPGEDDKPETPYYKAKHTAKEVSISTHDEFTDGLGRKWKNAIIHAALVNNPIVPDQDSFQDGSTIVNMSMMESSNNDTLLGELIEALRTNLNIVLPGSCTVETFMRDLQIAVLQVGNKNSGPEIETVPIYMSVGETEVPLSKAQAEAIVASKQVNPDTKQPFTMEDLGYQKQVTPPVTPATDDSSKVKELTGKLTAAGAMLKALMSRTAKDRAANMQKRINDLVAKGVVAKEFADANLLPKVQVEMSIVGDDFSEHPLEATLSTLEALPVANKDSGTPNSNPLGFLEPSDLDNDTELSPEDMKANIAALKEFLS